MTTRTPPKKPSSEALLVAAAFAFIVGILFAMPSFYVLSGLLVIGRISLHLTGIGRVSPPNFRQQRSYMKYSR